MTGLALLAGGCASQQSGIQTAGVADGTVPSTSANTRPDNGDQPWSPNYGWQPRTPGFAPSNATSPADRVAGTTRYATTDPDTVIRHAVAAHEMRRQ